MTSKIKQRIYINKHTYYLETCHFKISANQSAMNLCYNKFIFTSTLIGPLLTYHYLIKL